VQEEEILAGADTSKIYTIRMDDNLNNKETL
jgi:hypothetical protein